MDERPLVVRGVFLENADVSSDLPVRLRGGAPMMKPILLVDDHAGLRRAMAELLQGEGYTVLQAADGDEALQSLRGGATPQVIVFDLLMPRMDGWQLRENLLADRALRDIPVIAMTPSQLDRRSRTPLQAYACLPKPFPPPRLLGLLRGIYRWQPRPAAPATEWGGEVEALAKWLMQCSHAPRLHD